MKIFLKMNNWIVLIQGILNIPQNFKIFREKNEISEYTRNKR